MSCHLLSVLAVKELIEYLLVLPRLFDDEVHPRFIRDSGPEHPNPALQEPEPEIVHTGTGI